MELLVALLGELGLGRPGPAREAAVSAATVDAANAHVHLYDATCAALLAGEPRAAARLLDECEAAAPEEESWQRRVAACRSWLWTLDRLWYPGDHGAEIASQVGSPPGVELGRPGDEETVEVESVSFLVFRWLSLRFRVENEVRRSPEQALATVYEHGVNPPVSYAHLVHGDLLHRAGGREEADGIVAELRGAFEQDPEDAGARAIVARSFLVEGDWYATPGSWPEALGFDLWTYNAPSPFAALRDLGRAAEAYDAAEEWIPSDAAPRLRAALALRRATLAWISGDHAAQQAFLRAAEDEYAAAGDAAGRWLTVIHGLLADVALGRIAATRRDAGTGFDLEARGPIAALRRWGERDGSVSWTSGLGRILQRAADAWGEQEDYARAEVAYEMAAPLTPVSGAESSAAIMLRLAELDSRNGLGVRAFTRRRSSVATLPPAVSPLTDVWAWAQNLDALGNVLSGQMDAEGTAAGLQVAAVDWAIRRLEEVLALPGVPNGDGTKAQAPSPLPERSMLQRPEGEQLVAGLAELRREYIAFARASVLFERGREADAAGASEAARRWYDDALALLAGSPFLEGMKVIFLAGLDRYDEARDRLQALRDGPGVDEDTLAIASLRARDYETANRLFSSEPDAVRPWYALLNHAEAAFGAGDVDRAASLSEQCVRDFEEHLGNLRRDVDRVAACDDTRLAGLYLLAARAQLAAAAGSDARAFELSDRARTLTLNALLADASERTDDERLVLAWRQSTSEWQAAHDRLGRAYVEVAGDDEVRDRIAALSSAERRLVEVEADLERLPARSPAARPLSALRDVQDALPRDAVLLEYQLAGNDLLVWSVTRTTARAHASRHATGVIARLATAVQHGCVNGDPGPEAASLAELVLEPVGSVLDACERVIVVPYGRLHGLPFQVLPIHGRPLGETHVVSYVPAAALVAGATVDAPLRGARALVVGDPAFDAGMHPGLGRLPGAALEARAVAETNRVHPLIGAEAAEATIRRELGRCDVVHLAAHGRLDPIAPSDSSIVLAGRDELTVSDLVGLRIDSELVVLSACDSGRGAASLGGDVVGLARGLLAAGVRRAVVSLWPVDDGPACATMDRFHRHLAEGAPVARALHAAQADVRAMSGAEIARSYLELGGDRGEAASSRRRGVSLSPADDVDSGEALGTLSGGLARVWAPFVAIGA
jgi:CHAT domain-containing protein